MSIEEDTGSLLIRVLRDQGLTGDVSVVYVITNGGAVNGEDFTAVSLDVGFTNRACVMQLCVYTEPCHNIMHAAWRVGSILPSL